MANFMDTDIAKSYDFQKFSKPIEEFYLFLQWQMDLYCLDGELANEYNRFLQQLYYIKLSEYLISGKRTLSNLSSINTIKDDIAVKDLINFQQELLNNLSEEEFQYIHTYHNKVGNKC